MLIKEITRRCNLEGIFQAIYTAGVVIPTPISTCRYYHRTLNVPKLVDAKFTYVPRDMTIARMIRKYKAPSTLALSRSGLREMEEKDVSAVVELYKRYMDRFDMVPLLEEDDVRHQFLSGRGKGERETSTGRRPGQVVWTYVVEASFTTTFLCLSSAVKPPYPRIRKLTPSRTSSHSTPCHRRSCRIRGIAS